MKRLMFFLYFVICMVVFTSAIGLSKLQDLMVDNKYDIHGIFYKYDFANVQSAWDFVYVSKNVFYQLKGTDITSNNTFGWKVIDAIAVSSPSFYFVYLSDIDEDNETKYDWVALDKANSTAYKLNGSTSNGYFSWSDNLSKLSFSFSDENKKVTFHRSINVGNPIKDEELPDLPDLPDRLIDIKNSQAESNSSSDETNIDNGSNGDNNNNDSNGSINDNNSSNNNDSNENTNDDENTNNDENTNDDEDNDCTSYVDDYGDSAPSPGVCLTKDKK